LHGLLMLLPQARGQRGLLLCCRAAMLPCRCAALP
jgi:hypothetical protein